LRTRAESSTRKKSADSDTAASIAPPQDPSECTGRAHDGPPAGLIRRAEEHVGAEPRQHGQCERDEDPDADREAVGGVAGHQVVGEAEERRLVPEREQEAHGGEPSVEVDGPGADREGAEQRQDERQHAEVEPGLRVIHAPDYIHDVGEEHLHEVVRDERSLSLPVERVNVRRLARPDLQVEQGHEEEGGQGACHNGRKAESDEARGEGAPRRLEPARLDDDLPQRERKSQTDGGQDVEKRLRVPPMKLMASGIAVNTPQASEGPRIARRRQ
jgi:hypothetical protein